MRILSRLFRLGLVSVAAFGAYLILVEYRYSEACRLEIERLEEAFNETLSSAKWPYVKAANGGRYQLNRIAESSLTSWLYYVPAGKSMTVLHVGPDTSESVLLEFPASEKEQRGRLYVQLSILPEGNKVEFFGTQSLIATFKATDKSRLELNEISVSIPANLNSREIFQATWQAKGPRWATKATTVECSSTHSIILCKWVELEVDANLKMIERQHALKIITK